MAIYPIGAFVFLILSTKSFVFRKAQSDFDSGVRRLHRYWAVLWVAVPMYEIIGRRGNFSILSCFSKNHKKKLGKTAPRVHKERHLLSTTKYVCRPTELWWDPPLGALFANIFMFELENTIIPLLGDKVRQWKRYVDDTFAFIKPNTEQEIQLALNAFHKNIKFTCVPMCLSVCLIICLTQFVFPLKVSKFS